MRRRTKQTFIFYTIVITVVSNLLLPSLAVALESGTRVLLCTAQGYKWVTISEQEPVELSSQGGPFEHCVYCLNPHDDSDSTLFQASSLKLQLAKFKSKARDFMLGQLNYLHSHSHARAPPFFI